MHTVGATLLHLCLYLLPPWGGVLSGGANVPMSYLCSEGGGGLPMHNSPELESHTLSEWLFFGLKSSETLLIC